MTTLRQLQFTIEGNEPSCREDRFTSYYSDCNKVYNINVFLKLWLNGTKNGIIEKVRVGIVASNNLDSDIWQATWVKEWIKAKSIWKERVKRIVREYDIPFDYYEVLVTDGITYCGKTTDSMHKHGDILLDFVFGLDDRPWVDCRRDAPLFYDLDYTVRGCLYLSGASVETAPDVIT